MSFALPARCDVTIASMMRQPAVDPPDSGPRRLPVRTWLPPALPWSRLPRRYSTLFYRSDLPRLVATGDYDLVHLHNPTPALELERTAQACLARGIPYVVSTHGFNEVANGVAIYGFDPLRAAVWQRFAIDPVRRVVRRAAAIFALSEARLYAGQAPVRRAPRDIVVDPYHVYTPEFAARMRQGPWRAKRGTSGLPRPS